MEILRVENLTFTYPLCDKPAVENLTFEIEQGEFVVVCGATGSGKSTLLRLLKRELSPIGSKSGEVYFRGAELEKMTDRDAACRIGYVMQRPEQQIVTDKVWHELAFGLENMGVSQDVMARRVAEMAGYFGMESWYERNISELSGGQKQLLNLASVMVMQPDVLILDEPTAQLDPIAASDFVGTIKKLNQDFSLTVIMVEHHLEEVIPVCDRLMVIENGQIAEYDEPGKVILNLNDRPEIMCAMPAASRIYAALSSSGECPMTVKDGRNFIENNFSNNIRELPVAEADSCGKPAMEFKDVYFRYERSLPDILNGLSMTVYENEVFCILGGNGSGKTTTLSAAANLLRIYSGSISVFGKKLKEYKNQSLYRGCLSYLPQDVQTVFLKNTVREELKDSGFQEGRLPFDISYLYDKHPYDLSGGEQQLVALAKVLSTEPKLLLLDEPTKGLDAYAKQRIIRIIRELKASGVTVVVVTHDVDFASLCADRCALFFKGKIVSTGVPSEFFSENSFYTTAANRMTRGYYDNVVSVEQAVELCRRNGHKDGGR